MGRRKEKAKEKRVQVSFTEDQWKIIEGLKGVMGSDDAEVVRSIVIAWLSEKSLIADYVMLRSLSRRDLR